ncbi:MAG: helicase C-terminal domain-containing protein [Candidatus Aenigmatarchaeota archaeon]
MLSGDSGHRTAFQPPAHTWVNEGVAKLLSEKNVVVTTYNYILNSFMRSSLLRRMNARQENVILIIDEAHNLHRFSLHPESQTISIELLKKAGEEAKTIDEELSFSLINLYEALKEKELKSDEEILPREMFEVIDFSKCFHYGSTIQEEKLIKGETPLSYLLSIADFIELCYKKDTMISINVDRYLEAIELKRIEIFNKVFASVSMSGTIKPFECYMRIVGLPEDKTIAIETPYPFPKENFKVMLINDVSTKFTERNEVLYQKIYKIINSAWRIEGGILVAFPSYELLEDFDKFIKSKNHKFDAETFIEKRWMSSIEINNIYHQFIEKALNDKALLLCVAGGRLAEGVDYVANVVKVVIVIGIPYPKPSEKIIELLKYYEKLFDKKGRLYGYIIPALWTSLQASGRGIRSEHDTCLLIFADKRYEKLRKLLPTWISENIQKISIEKLEDAVDNSLSMLY